MPEASDIGLGAASLAMGSAWAVFLARACLGANFEAMKAPTIARGKPSPSFCSPTSFTRPSPLQG
eukprot:7985290-Pyramimonas_sp.AAC.1